MKRSKFSLSNYRLLTCDMGKIIPIGLTEVLPGDTFQQSTSALVRVSPLVAPVMHPVHIRIHHWFVPHRLVWDNWEKFITGGPDGNDATVPPRTSNSAPVGALADYYGIPPNNGTTVVFSALPFRGYSLIFNEWYRDQDLVAERAVPKTDGPDATVDAFNLARCAWEKDYFTTCRPWVSKGNDVTLPVGVTAPVLTSGVPPTFSGGGLTNQHIVTQSGNTDARWGGSATANASMAFGSTTGLVADLQNATAVSINDLREAFALQRYQEARARYGSRYTEYLAYLGVQSADSRLQRPEYLGGGKQTIQFSEVLQTGPDTEDQGVADLKGHGIGALRSNRYRRFFSEHGYIHSFMMVLPKTIYSEAVPRTFFRQTKEDFWQRELQHIGQQEVYNRELKLTHASPNAVFGYQDRYDEYRRSESGVSGEFRTTLDYWHMARIFATDPVLNSSFVSADPTKRVHAEQTQHSLWCMVNHSIQARRMVSRTGSSMIK